MKKTTLGIALIALWIVIQAATCKKDELTAIVPQSALDYIQANFPGYVPEEAETETLCDGTNAVEVEAEKSETEEIELVFDTNGNFLYSEQEMNASNLPAAVKSAVEAKFPGYKLDDEAGKLTLANGAVQFEVELEKGNTEKEVIFDLEGTLVCGG